MRHHRGDASAELSRELAGSLGGTEAGRSALSKHPFRCESGPELWKEAARAPLDRCGGAVLLQEGERLIYFAWQRRSLGGYRMRFWKWRDENSTTEVELDL